ncbi:hypothetical protein EHQ94_11030 [Leptospira meyeri]|uniref:LBF_2127 family putative lipoprotein n=1 Tax=Leptospira meyeri TaxID=29508 RepID=UPI0010825A8A|nr:hypothetical protein [Leptospira meyeri]TGM60622.1 hypothetical protein EHQ93_17875 [Leptospira meyeri]TGM66478.1 hypothetical protein EHQ94_11030 [Leptospira meyeri]
MKNSLKFILCISLAINCNIDVRQLPTPKEFPENNINDLTKKIFIRNFEFKNNLIKDVLPAWKFTLISYLKNDDYLSKNFSFIDNNTHIDELHTIDIFIEPIFIESRNYWWSLPVIFPFSGYWPIHYRNLEYSVNIYFYIYKKNNLIYSNQILEKDNLSLYFYGLLRTQKFEYLIENTNLKAMNACVNSISLFFAQF